MKLRSNRRVEREAMNAVRSLFESCGYVCQEVDLGNDYGKDLYVDVTVGDQVTGLCIAVQVKGGASYRRKGHYQIPLNESHLAVWRQSSVPLAGIVYDPDDRQMRWCNISRMLGDNATDLAKGIRVDENRIINRNNIETEFAAEFRDYHNLRSIGLAALQLTSSDEKTRREALRDCFILGRSDARVLILIRNLLHTFEGNLLRLAVDILGHATPHPDILWHKGNWIPQETCDVVCGRFRWSVPELCRLIAATGSEEWHRGGFGQMVYSLICLDPEIDRKIVQVAHHFLNIGDGDNAFWCMYLAIYWAHRNGSAMLDQFISEDERFGSLSLVSELRSILQEQGQVILFE